MLVRLMFFFFSSSLPSSKKMSLGENGKKKLRLEFMSWTHHLRVMDLGHTLSESWSPHS